MLLLYVIYLFIFDFILFYFFFFLMLFVFCFLFLINSGDPRFFRDQTDINSIYQRMHTNHVLKELTTTTT
jgi:hypothetical protein